MLLAFHKRSRGAKGHVKVVSVTGRGRRMCERGIGGQRKESGWLTRDQKGEGDWVTGEQGKGRK
jgi:hypothetical protein